MHGARAARNARTSGLFGELARDCMPSINQVFLTLSAGLIADALERSLYIVRKCIERLAAAEAFSLEDLYCASFSSRTIVYKGMFVAPQFAAFYPDLADDDFQSALALVHQRYSTNTMPSWYLAQPFRCMAHNGEINTLRETSIKCMLANPRSPPNFSAMK